jgi:hypothetical protein
MPGYQCCVCQKTIDASTHRLNPCALSLTSNFDAPRGERREQTFFCHIECFRLILADDRILYIVEPDFGTLGEADDEDEEEPENDSTPVH